MRSHRNEPKDFQVWIRDCAFFFRAEANAAGVKRTALPDRMLET